jgi:hypothetical protein
MGATSRTQWPKAPNVTDELRMSVKFVSMTLRMPMSPMTGDEMVVTRRRMDAMKMKATPVLISVSDVSYALCDKPVRRSTNQWIMRAIVTLEIWYELVNV